jgi:hypothetical protein
MNRWDVVREAGDAFLARNGVLAAFGYLLVEEAGVPIPVPGDFLMLTLGVRAGRRRAPAPTSSTRRRGSSAGCACWQRTRGGC